MCYYIRIIQYNSLYFIEEFFKFFIGYIAIAYLTIMLPNCAYRVHPKRLRLGLGC